MFPLHTLQLAPGACSDLNKQVSRCLCVSPGGTWCPHVLHCRGKRSWWRGEGLELINSISVCSFQSPAPDWLRPIPQRYFSSTSAPWSSDSQPGCCRIFSRVQQVSPVRCAKTIHKINPGRLDCIHGFKLSSTVISNLCIYTCDVAHITALLIKPLESSISFYLNIIPFSVASSGHRHGQKADVYFSRCAM